MNVSDSDIGNLASTTINIDGTLYYQKTVKGLQNIWIQRNKIHDIAQTNDDGPNMLQISGAQSDLGQLPAHDIYLLDNDIYGKNLHANIDIMSFAPGNPPLHLLKLDCIML